MGLSISPICTNVNCGGLIVSLTYPVKPIIIVVGKSVRGYCAPDASKMPPKRKASVDNASPRRATRRRQQQPVPDATPVSRKKDSSLDVEPDELNLAPTKPLVPPSTPGARPSRVVMDCVEITTPRAIALRDSAPCASPATDLKLKGASALKVPSTPSRRLHPPPASPLFISKAVQLPSTPSRVRPPFTPRTSPPKLQQYPDYVSATPSKRASRPSAPKKGRDPIALPSSVRLPNVLPAHLVSCLRLQKRVILDAIRSPMSSEDVDDESESSTNGTAYNQLRSLLHGTTTRGEGNSCLLLGPRGSGKTSVRLSHTSPAMSYGQRSI